jgi:hypothetical protein
MKRRFVYPIAHDKPLPNTDPNDIVSWALHKVSDPWYEYTQRVDEHIKQNILDKDSHIPIGTKLYHCTYWQDSIMTNPNLMFFGIDVVISLWYLAEQYNPNKPDQKGILYEFVVTKPIPTILLEGLLDNSKESFSCWWDKACIHPQITYHSRKFAPPYDLGIEVTFYLKYYKDSIQLRKTYSVDTQMLLDNQEKTFKEWNPTLAIVIPPGKRKTKRTRCQNGSRKNKIRVCVLHP